VVAPVAPASLAAEVGQLPAEQLLLTSGPYRVYYAHAGQIPSLLQEIGRLREITFRAVGEGTGRAIDLDRFDAHYLHLFVWQGATQEVVGAYRLGRTDRILASQGQKGLYTATLFNFAAEFLQGIQPALELGRSFVRQEYQKNYAALLLLWKGIGRYLVQRPQYQYLFGPVSISNAYNEFAQGLLATWLSMHRFLPELAPYIRPKYPFLLHPDRNEELRLALAGTEAVEDLSALLAEVDPHRRGVPVLLRQYLKLGGKILGFNRDPHFNQALDGLILVDLRQTPAPVLQRYMGKEGWVRFAACHGQDPRKAIPVELGGGLEWGERPC
jgi:putative hemolysin